MTKDHDLWFAFFRKPDTMYALGLQVTAAKITSRQDEKLYADVVERWGIAGNDAADRAASLAYTCSFPPMCWQFMRCTRKRSNILSPFWMPFFQCVCVRWSAGGCRERCRKTAR